MNGVLSNEVKQALQDIYYNVRTGRGAEAFALLEKASEAGDGDATCVLARCLCGYQYVWGGHKFPEDDKRATKLLHKSVEQGSALGVLVALRSGELTPSVQKKMPFESLQAAFDEVEAMAAAGDAFCQYVVGNSYFWWDFLRIQNKGKDSFPNQAAFKAYLKENISRCEDWFWKAFRGGVHFAANNLNRYYTQGDEDIIAPQPEKAKDLWKIGAELGYPTHQYIYAADLKKEGKYEEALHWFQESAAANNSDCWFEIGFLYWEGKGVPQDYAKAFHHLSIAHDVRGNKWGVFYLAKCCFNGWGVPQDYARALQYLDEMDWDHWEANYFRGVIYGRGLGGVQADIPKAVACLQKAGNHPEPKEELLHYKKTLFGKWVRR